MFGSLGDFPVSPAKKLVFEYLLLWLLTHVCAVAPTHGHTLTGPVPLVTAGLSLVSSTVHSAAATLFNHLSDVWI